MKQRKRLFSERKTLRLEREREREREKGYLRVKGFFLRLFHMTQFKYKLIKA